VLLIDRRGDRGVGGVEYNAEANRAQSEGSGRSLRTNNEWIHEESKYTAWYFASL
jgi:hypothetical protein